jgi:hypothetical protein
MNQSGGLIYQEGSHYALHGVKLEDARDESRKKFSQCLGILARASLKIGISGQEMTAQMAIFSPKH